MNAESAFLDIKKLGLSITPDLIRYNEATLACDEVTRIRWGIAGIYHTVWIGAPTKLIQVECAPFCARFVDLRHTSLQRYQAVTDALWGAVGSRMVKEVLAALSKGKTVHFGRCVASCEGIHFVTRKWRILKGKAFEVPWEDVAASLGDGIIVLQSRFNANASLSLPPRETDNWPVLRAVLGVLQKPSG